MSRETSDPTDPAGGSANRPPDPSSGAAPASLDARAALMWELANEIRANQRATDMVDDVSCQIMGINRTDGRCLDALEQQGRMTAGQLAQAAGLTSGAITAAIDRLERAGYAIRLRDPADRRRVLVEATPRAIALATELMGPLIRESEPMVAAYSDEQLGLLVEFQRQGRELQERHAQRLRARLADERTATRAP